MLGDELDVLHPVVHVEHLAFAQQLAPDRLGNHAVVVLADVGEDRLTVLGRGVDERHVADAGDRQLERARDGRGGQREHVDVGPDRLDALLVDHAEALLLVDHEQAEVFELHILGEQPVGADHHVDVARRERGDHPLLVAGGEEAGDHLDPHRVVREAVAEGLAVLVGEEGRGHEDRHLLAVLYRLERGAHRDLGLAEADVTADEAVHRHLALHVGLHRVDRGLLVGRLLEGERILHLVLPRRVGGERVARGREAAPVQHDELLRDLARGRAHPGLRLLEVGAAHAVQRRRVAAGVLAHRADLVGGYVELVVALVLEQQVVALGAADGARDHAVVARDPVGLVHDVVALGQVLVEVDRFARAAHPPVHAPPSREVGLRDERDLRAAEHRPALERCDHDADLARHDRVAGAVDAVLVEHVGEAGRAAGAVGRDHHPEAVGPQLGEPLPHPLGAPDHRIEAGGLEQRGVGRLGGGEQVGGPGRGVREQAVERERQAGRVVAHRTPGRRERRGERGFVVEELLGAVADAARLAQQDEGLGGEQVGEEVVVLAEPRQPRLHAVERLTLGQALPVRGPPRLLPHERRGAGPYLGRGQQLASGEDHGFGDIVGGALVGDRERGEPVDLVAPQVDPDRVVVGRRVDVDDRAAHRHLAPGLHLVLAAIAHVDEADHQGVTVEVRAGADVDRLDVLHVRTEPLHQRPDRRDQHGRQVTGAQTPHHPQAPAHRLDRRRHPLERQRLPGGELLDGARGEELGQVVDHAVGVVEGRHRDHDRTARADVRQRGDEQRPRRVGHRDHRLAPDHRAQGRLLGEEWCQRCERRTRRHRTFVGSLSSWRRLSTSGVDTRRQKLVGRVSGSRSWRRRCHRRGSPPRRRPPARA